MTEPKDGFDQQAFAARLNEAAPKERREVWRNFGEWIREGARQQGWRSLVGVMLLLSPGGVILLFFAGGQGPAWWAYIFAAMTTCIGAWLVHAGFRRERDWRRRNPFRP